MKKVYFGIALVCLSGIIALSSGVNEAHAAEGNDTVTVVSEEHDPLVQNNEIGQGYYDQDYYFIIPRAIESTQSEFLAAIKSGAIAGWKNYQVLPSVSAAQAILESGWGSSGLSVEANNLFGIKGSYNGQSVTYPTKEYINGEYVTVNAEFRKYPNWAASIEDHGRFLSENSRYSNLLGVKDAATVANLLHQDGYATEPDYASLLMELVNEYNLTEWDQEAFAGGTTTTPPTSGSISTIQTWLNTTYSSGLEVDNIAGAATKKAIVIAVQTELNKQFGAGLVVDGVFGAASDGAWVYLFEGDVPGNITKLCQAMLMVKGYNPNGFDGIFGAGMKAAVIQYQADHGLEQDGILGAGTASSLFN